MILLVGMLVMVFPQTGNAVSVVNSVSVESVSGGLVVRGVDGKDGADGKNGENGKPGSDGTSVSVGTASVSAKAKVAIDGTVLVDTETKTPTNESREIESLQQRFIATTTQNTATVAILAMAGGNARSFDTDVEYRGIREILSSISLIMMSYVNKLF